MSAKLDNFERESKLRDETLMAKIDSGQRLTQAKLEAPSAKMEAQYQSILFNLNLDKRSARWRATGSQPPLKNFAAHCL